MIAPVLWSGLLHSVLDFINPVLNQRIDWLWFVVSQLGFGIVAGLVVSRQQRIATWQHLPLAIRAGIEAPGAIDEQRWGGPAMIDSRATLIARCDHRGSDWRGLQQFARASRAGFESASRPTRSRTSIVLYAKNCAGCHGPDGKGGAAIPLADPVFLAIADDARHSPDRNHRSTGHSDAGLRKSAGGMLTDKQIDCDRRRNPLLGEARSPQASRTSLPTPPRPLAIPRAAQQVYATYCSSCHGPDGRGGTKASSIVNGSYLALVSDQNLRTIVIVGRPELGAPDWRINVPGSPCRRRTSPTSSPGWRRSAHSFLARERNGCRGRHHEATTMSTRHRRFQARDCSSRSGWCSTESSGRFWPCRSCATSCRP